MNESVKLATILLVEEDVDFRKTLAEVLGHEGYEVIPCEDRESAAFWLGSICAPLDLIIADVSRETVGATEFWGRVTRALPFVPLLLMTTDDEPELREAAARTGASGVLAKPFDMAEVLSVVDRVILETNVFENPPHLAGFRRDEEATAPHAGVSALEAARN